MYKPRQYPNNRATNNQWRRPHPALFSAPFSAAFSSPHEAGTQPTADNGIDYTLLLERNIYDGLLANAIARIALPSDDEPGDEDLQITDFKCIGSYSWIEAPKHKPTILVPGSPCQWKNESPPIQVSQPDKGPRIIDQNGFRTSVGGIGYLLPTIAAVNYNQTLKEEPPFDWSSVDIVADRSALRKLGRWANKKLVFSQKVRKSDKLFRLDLQLVGKETVLINRVSLKYAEGDLYVTYREGFKKIATTPAPGCKNALDYNRIASYNLDGLKMVVRFEADAYDSGAPRSDQVEELAASLQATSVQPPTTLQTQGLTIQKAGEEMPQTDLLELGTRWVQNRFPVDWSEIYCQSFLSHIPKHIMAYQDNGMFSKIEERKLDSAPEFAAAKAEGQLQMKKLVKVIRRIRELVLRAGKDSRLSLVCVYGVLHIYRRRGEESCLPDEVLELFE